MSIARKWKIISGRGLAALTFLGSALFAAGGTVPAWSAPERAAPKQAMVRLRGHVPIEAVAHARLLGRVAQGEAVSLALALPLRDPVGTQNFLRRLYDPADPVYGHYLTPEQFTARFGPTEQSYQAVIAFARARGLTVTGTHPTRLLLDVSGPASAVETAFGVHLLSYRSLDGHAFRAPDADPLVPVSLGGRLSGVIGLNTAAVWRSHLHRLQPRLRTPARPSDVGTGPQGGLTPGNIKTAYNLKTVTASGAGQTLALFELDGYDPADIAGYENAYSLSNVSLQNIYVDGANGTINDPLGALEVTLDIELMTALASSATSILVYEAPRTSPASVDLFSRIASDNSAKEVSTSWGYQELGQDPTIENAENTIFQQMAIQGQSVYAAAGDNGAYDDGQNLSVDDPASQPFVTGVGGTKLTTASPGGPYQTEQTWGDPTEQSTLPDDTHGSGGGGGISVVWPIPDYQVGFGASATQRNVPDVSLNADPATGYSIYFGGSFTVVGGTSTAAPLWAGFTALVNQQRQTLGQSSLGFANRTLYRLAAGANYATGFHDIADGSTNLYYKAGTGYDNATGLGSFNGAELLNLLATPTNGAVNPIASLVLQPQIIVGGLKALGTVTLANPAPTGGAVVTLTTNNQTTTLPASVIVAAGGTTASFSVTTSAVMAVQQAVITASLNNGTLTSNLTITPDPGTIAPMSLSFAPASTCGGTTATATLTLSGAALTGGLVAQLSSDSPAASVPASVTVPEGQTSTTFDVSTIQVSAPTLTNISVSANNVTKTAALTVQSPVLEPFSFNPGRITGGRTGTATISLTCPAPPSGVTVMLSSDNPTLVMVPASVTFPANATQTSFSISTIGVSSPVKVLLTASFAGASQTTPLTVQPGGLVGLTIQPTTLTGGTSAMATLTLDANAPPGGLGVGIASSDPAVIVPATITVPAGKSSFTFPVVTSSVSALTAATLTATLGGATETASLTVLPIRAISLVFNPARIIISGASTGNITLNAPAPVGGLVVALSTDSPKIVTVPTTVLVPAGQTSTTFSVTGVQVGTAGITATLGGQTQTASLTVSSAPGTTYPAGLNLISVPYDYSGIALDTVFGFASVKLAVWQPELGQYALTPTVPADTLRPGRGYWVNLPRALTLTRVGVPTDMTQDFPISLLPGWNQIGDPFPVPIKLGITRATGGGLQVPFAQASTTVPLLLSSLVYRYQPAQASATGVYVWTRDSDFLQPGQGYWVYAYQSVTLTIPHPAQ